MRAFAAILFLAVIMVQVGVLWAIDWLVETYQIREWLIAFYG